MSFGMPPVELARAAVEVALVAQTTPGLRDRIRASGSSLIDLVQSSAATLRAMGMRQDAAEALAGGRHRQEARSVVDLAISNDYYLFIVSYKPYPDLLQEITDAPIVLYGRGCVTALDSPGVAIVGTRHPTHYGSAMAEGLASDLAERGIAVTSGLARGIDGAAHRGALRCGGVTVAVLGCGIDVAYPREHRRLADQITETGLLLSEYPPGTPPFPQNFPARNRIISGLTFGTVVVEARDASGSLITARLALEQNRDVFAIPGNITSPPSAGPNFLIKQGARLVQSWRDVVTELPSAARARLRIDLPDADSRGPDTLSTEEAHLLENIPEDRAVQFDTLAGGSAEIGRRSKVLLELELRGHIRQLPGGLFVKVTQRKR